MPQSRFFNVANMSFYNIRENKILAIIFEFTVLHVVEWKTVLVSEGNNSLLWVYFHEKMFHAHT